MRKQQLEGILIYSLQCFIDVSDLDKTTSPILDTNQEYLLSPLLQHNILVQQ